MQLQPFFNFFFMSLGFPGSWFASLLAEARGARSVPVPSQQSGKMAKLKYMRCCVALRLSCVRSVGFLLYGIKTFHILNLLGKAYFIFFTLYFYVRFSCDPYTHMPPLLHKRSRLCAS